MNRRWSVVFVVLALLTTIGAVYAQREKGQINPRRHPNLAAAQRMVEQSLGRITAAQKANEYDMEGHAQKAKELLEQANRELKMATGAANRNK